MNSSSVSQSPTVTVTLEVKTQQDIQEEFWWGSSDDGVPDQRLIAVNFCRWD